jgi:uncharacterized protein (DUF1501 family)
MDALTRRRFLAASGVAGGGALLSFPAAMTFADLLSLGSDDPGVRSIGEPDTLVMVTLYGGNDGLNTVIPYADAAYHAARPELAYAPESVLPLDDRLGLNPKLAKLRRMWDDKRLAIVLGVGYPRPNRSHFASMDIWHTASPVRPVSTGWVGRWLDATKASPATAISFEPVLPPMLAGETRSGACVTGTAIDLPLGIKPETVLALGSGGADGSTEQSRAAAAYHELIEVSRLVRRAEDKSATPGQAARELGPAEYSGSSALGRQLARVARCVEANVPTTVYSVSMGGFDTHAVERPGHESLLQDLDDGLAWFVERMSRSTAGKRVVVVVYSEFGRRVQGNASKGTDHGTAGPLFVLGPRVIGGLYGEQPSLADLDNGDLKATTDFRDVFATVIDSVLGMDPARLLDGYKPRLFPLFQTS